MTVILGKAAIPDATWSAMPGWGIVADLTPPELRARRSMLVLRRVVAASLVLVVLLGIGGYLLAGRADSAAQADLDAATAQTAVIQTQISSHSSVTRVQDATTGIDSQLSALFATDVDLSGFVLDLARSLPAGMTITSVSVTMQDTATSTLTGSDSEIGTVSLAGKSADLNGLASYVKALNTLRGVSAVIPATNAAGSGSASWTLTLQLTTARSAHRFGKVTPASTTGASLTPTTTVAPTDDDTTGGS